MSDNAYKVLCVDDERRVLESLERHLRSKYAVLTAASGAEGLKIVAANSDLAVVVSDMRMPGMDGATFLSHTRALNPSAVRILLTGQSDLAAAIRAINEGQIFRFLAKPCAAEQILSVLGEAVRQYELVAAERLLLQRTLVGALKALTDVMALVNPDVVGRAQRLKRRVSAITTQLRMENQWQVEAAALLSHLGHLSLPDSITRKLSRGRGLELDEIARVRDATSAANRLIAHVPRLEPVSAILMALMDPDASELALMAPPDPRLVAILQLSAEAERLEAQGILGTDLIKALEDGGKYPPELLPALRESIAAEAGGVLHGELAIAALRTGMILDEDIRTSRGVLIAPRGCEVTLSFIEHIRHFEDQLAKPTAAVFYRRPADDVPSHISVNATT
jgi:CheY-like chemotaxis protein